MSESSWRTYRGVSSGTGSFIGGRCQESRRTVLADLSEARPDPVRRAPGAILLAELCPRSRGGPTRPSPSPAVLGWPRRRGARKDAGSLVGLLDEVVDDDLEARHEPGGDYGRSSAFRSQSSMPPASGSRK
jgi:hypothetical protein